MGSLTRNSCVQTLIWRDDRSCPSSAHAAARGVEEQMQAGNSTDLALSSGTSTAQSEREEKKTASAEAPEQPDLFARAQRRKLPDERKSITHKFSVGGHEGYIIVGMYEEGEPGEVFIKM